MPGVWAGMSGVTSCGPRLMFGISSPFRGQAALVRFERSRTSVELLKETIDLAPHVLAAAEAPPPGSDHSHQPVAVLDRNKPHPARALDTVDEQRLHVGLHGGQHRIG